MQKKTNRSTRRPWPKREKKNASTRCTIRLWPIRNPSTKLRREAILNGQLRGRDYEQRGFSELETLLGDGWELVENEDDPEAELAPFANPQVAHRISAMIDRGMSLEEAIDFIEQRADTLG